MTKSAFFNLAAVSLLACWMFAPLDSAQAADPNSRRLSVRQGVLYKSTSPATVRAIETPHLFTPNSTQDEMVNTFIRVSDVGATGVWFDLEGISADGATMDPAYVEALRTVKAACIYRYITPVCRLFGEGASTDDAYRAAVVRTVAKTFTDDHAMLYWIDGPKSDELVAQFKSLAPKLTVLAPREGDCAFVYHAKDISDRRPTFLIGLFPDAWDSDLHCLMPGGDATYEAFEKAAADPIESQPWTPSTIGLTPEEKSEGFTSLFDGTSLAGWTITGRNKEGFGVKDGTIVWRERGGGTLRTRDRYGDFVLRFEYRIPEVGANSGIQVRTPRANRASKLGFEFQIMGDHGVPPDIHTTGAVYDVVAPLVNAARPEDEWNEVELRLEGPRYVARLNGVVVQDLNFDENDELRPRLRRGFILLQDHDCPIAFRRIRIKQL